MSDAELFIRCDCHSPDHMLIFDVWHWDTERPQSSELSVHYGLDPCLSVWQRFYYAVQFALTGKTGKWWWADTVIKEADTVRLRDYLNAYLSQSLNPPAQGIEAATAAETVELGSVHESPVGGNADAPKED